MLGVIEQVTHRSKDRAPTPHDLLALFGQLDARLAPLYEANLQLILELLDLHAECRLGDSAILRRLAEMPRRRQGFEITQLAEGHHSDNSRLCLWAPRTINFSYHVYKEKQFYLIRLHALVFSRDGSLSPVTVPLKGTS